MVFLFVEMRLQALNTLFIEQPREIEPSPSGEFLGASCRGLFCSSHLELDFNGGACVALVGLEFWAWIFLLCRSSALSARLSLLITCASLRAFSSALSRSADIFAGSRSFGGGIVFAGCAMGISPHREVDAGSEEPAPSRGG
jgi:hypothetical protein